MITMFFLGALCGVVITVVLLSMITPEFEATVVSDGLPPMESLDPPVPEPKEFPIAGKPKRIPWAVKRRELEAQKREKRRRMEEWG